MRGLPEAEQDAIASMVLAEIEDERKWEESFARSPEPPKPWPIVPPNKAMLTREAAGALRLPD